MSYYAASSRVSGWGNWSEGYNLSELYPWRKRYQREGRYRYSYLSERKQEIVLSYVQSSYKKPGSYVPGLNNQKIEEAYAVLSKIIDCGLRKKLVHDVPQYEIVFLVDNPYSENDVRVGNANGYKINPHA